MNIYSACRSGSLTRGRGEEERESHQSWSTCVHSGLAIAATATAIAGAAHRIWSDSDVVFEATRIAAVIVGRKASRMIVMVIGWFIGFWLYSAKYDHLDIAFRQQRMTGVEKTS